MARMKTAPESINNNKNNSNNNVTSIGNWLEASYRPGSRSISEITQKAVYARCQLQ